MTLPILVSVPHGGWETPSEVVERACITPEDLFDDADACTADIYRLDAEVAHWHSASVARAFVDLNRSPDDLPPSNPDGVVKTATCYGRPIYVPGRELDASATNALLARYYHPYHRKLEESSADTRLKLALDCHSMAITPPQIAPDDRPRPLFCLSNGDGRTAPGELMNRLRVALAESFGIGEADIRMNDPFKGGHITRRHGTGRVPWIQVEMNRSFYLTEPWFRRQSLAVDTSRLQELRMRFLEALGALGL